MDAVPRDRAERKPDGDEGSLARLPPETRRGRGNLRALGVASSRVARPIIARQGGGVLAQLKTEWDAIVGPDWAAVTWPAALGRDGALKLRVIPAEALQIQHRSPLLLERINMFFGRPVATRLVLVQGPLPLPAAPRPALPRPLSAAEAEALDRRLATVADAELRAALARLGRAVIGSG